MAANDTLKIAVQIVEDDKKNVESLVKKVQLMLDKDFKLKVSDDGALKHLEEILSVLKQIQQEMGNLSGHLGKDTWGKLSQNTQDAVVSINKLSAELERLDTKFAKTFGKAMGTAWAKEMKKGEQGAKDAGDAAKKAAHDENELSTAIVKTSSSVAQCTTMLNRMVESSREAGSATHGIVENMRSMDVAGKRLAQIDSILAQISKRTIASQALGFDIGHLERMADVLRKTRAEFLQVFMGRGYAEIPGLGMMDANSLATNRLYETQTTAIQKEMKAVDELAESMRRLQDIQRTLREKANGGNISAEMRTRLLSASEEITATMQKMAGPRVETSAEVNTALKEQIRGYEQLSKEAARASDEETKGNERVRKSLNDLLTLINDLNNRMKSMKMVGVDSSKIQSLQQTINTIQAAYDRLSGMGGTSGGRFIKTAEYDTNYELYRRAVSDANQAIREQTKENRDNDKAKREAAKSTEKLSTEEKKLANAMKQTTQQGFLQTNVLNDLKSMAAQYLSIWGAKSFVENMAQITGELELQQKSLEVIIGSASYASQLFGEIRDLSQQSPYTFQDLLKSTRQLAAFGIETKDLYGTMKSLSDIGAGLSVDVQRLILAYGHTKSYGYLSGIQNRQFETAGIDLVGALADRYNKLADAEERAGRAAEHVTRKDVFKMISKKEVGFEDVNAVIMGLDAPGGRFYNMQERQFETLGGKLRNLRNNYNIMMAEMGKANHGMLMGGVNMLNELTEHWDKYARIITSILVPLGAFRLATLAVNSAIGLQSDAMAKNVMAMVKSQKATRAATIAMMNGMNNASWKNAFGIFGGVGAAWKASGDFVPSEKDKKSFKKILEKGFNSGNISRSQLMMWGTSNKLDDSYRRISLSVAGLNKQHQDAIIKAKGWQRALLRLRYSLGMGAAAIRSFGAAIASLAVQMAPMAIIGGLVALYSHFKSMADETRESLDQLAKNAKEDAKSIDDTIAKYRERGVTQTGGTSYLNGNRISAVGLSFDIDKIKEMTADDVEELKQELQKFSPFYEGDLVDISKFKTQAEQVMAIMRKLDSYRHAEQVIASSTGNYEESASGSFWGGGYDSFKENLEDMGKSMSKASAAVAKLSEEEVDNFDKELGGALSRAVKSGAAVNEAEALRQYLVRAMFMSDEDREKLEDSWSDGLKKVYYEAAKRQYFTGKNGRLYGPGFGNSLRYFIGQDVLGHHVFGKNAESHIESYNNSVSRLAETLQNDINKNYGANDIDGALKHAISVYESFAADAKGISEEAKQAGLQMLLQSVFGDGSNHKNAYIDFVNSEFAGEAYKEISESGAVNLWMKPEEIASKASEVIEKIKERWKGQGKDITKITKDTINSIVKTIQNDNTLENTWQKKLGGLGGEPLWKNFARFNSKRIKDNTMEADMWDEIRKRYKELQEKLNGEKLVMQTKFGIELKPEIFMDSSKILEQMKKLNTNGQFYKDKNGKWQVSFKNTGAAYDEYKRYLPLMNTFSELYYDLKGAEDRIVQLWDDKNKRGGGRGTYKDRESDVWEQRIKLIQEARREYDYWEKQIGKEAAQEKVKKQFENLVGADKVLNTGDLDDLEHYEKVLHEINNEISERYKKDQKLPAGQKKDVNIANDIKNLRELDNALYNIGKGEYERGTEDFLAGLTFRLEELTRQFEIFKSVRESSGDAALASRLTGIVPGATPADLKRLAISQFAGRQIDFNSVYRMNDEEIEDYVQKLGVPDKKIKSIVNGLKEWKKAEQDVEKTDIENYAKWLGSLVDLQSIRNRNQEEYNEILEETDRLLKKGDITSEEAERRRRAAKVQYDTKNWQATAMYTNLYSNAQALSESEFAVAYQEELDNLDAQLSVGAISIQEYTDKVERLNKVANEFATSGFLGIKGGVGAYLGGGVQGLLGYYQQRANKERLNGNEEEAKKWDERYKSLNEMQSAAEQLTKVFNDLSSGADMLANMFDALGMEGAANAFSDAGGVLSGIAGGASSLSALGPYGMAAGAAIGAVTSFAQLGDKQADRRIQKISDQLSHIENTLDTIRSYREKELGYSTGYSIRYLAQRYKEEADSMNAQIERLIRGGASAIAIGKAGKNANAVNAMAGYYGDVVSSSDVTLYAAEYNKLLEQRQKKMEQLNNEAAKKKVDGSKIEQYKKDIAELDAQVQEFASTLLNDLWGIDFKGWASQISDALMTAFENGTSAASAFHDTMEDIMADVVKRMMNLAIIEPFIKQLQNKIMGYTDQNGNYHAGIIDENNPDAFLDNPEEYVGKILKEIAEWSEVYQDKIAPAFLQGITGSEDILNQYGSSLRNRKSGKGSSSNSISQSITEETAGYLTGLLSAMHQDGSVRRLQLQTIVAEQMPNVIEQMTVSGSHIAGIDENTRAIMNMMNNGTGRMYERIDYIGTKLDRFASGLDKITAR